jgi:hypothetical protein
MINIALGLTVSSNAVGGNSMNRDAYYDQIARLAYFYWEHRGRPIGSPDIDWLRAERELLPEMNTADQFPLSSIQMGPTGVDPVE